jgi:DNA repair ATPase RecN
MDKELKDNIARNAASQWCRCFKCDGVVNATHENCDKNNLMTCLKLYDGYRTALLALGDDRVKEMNETSETEEKNKLIKSIEDLYNEFDQNITDLIKGRKNKIAALEGRAMYNLEKLAVETQQELIVILNYIREH